MEIYQYWALSGFVFLIVSFFSIKRLPLALCGSSFFASVFAFKFPDNYTVQIIAFLVFMPLIYLSLKNYKVRNNEQQ